ncbi:MAG: immunoglobulin-like domain-containing protein [Bacteroidales bacterium]
MKRFINIFVILSSIAGLILFTGCPGDDESAPRILFPESMDLHQDTTILLYQHFEDPGVFVEDNKDYQDDIELESDFEDEISLTPDGRVRSTGDFEITYTATDQAGNESEEVRTVRVTNPSEVIDGTYDVEGDYAQINDTTFTSRISPDNRTAGVVRFSKAYVHDVDGDGIYLKINGYLYSPEHSEDITDPTSSPSTTIGWLGSRDDSDVPFYEEMYYSQAMPLMTRYDYLHIPTQTFVDSVHEVTHTIRGIDDDSDLPRSRAYFNSHGDVVTVELHYNVSASNVPGGEAVRETYTPR